MNKIFYYLTYLLPDSIFLKLKYRIKMKKKLNLSNPKTYNEKLQWLKLHDRNPIYTKLVDKYEVKKYVIDKIGEEHVIPTIGIYDKFEDINFNLLPNQFVIKCTHDSGGLVVCRDKSKLNIDATKKIINKSLKRNYYKMHREWPYKNVKPRIIIEKYLNVSTPSGTKSEVQAKEGLLDYKFMCFNGKVELLFLDIGVIGKGYNHAEEYYRNVYDKNFKLLPIKETRDNYPIPIEKPKNFKKMVELAEKLSNGLKHVRIDLYNIEGKIYFGEMTFYHGSGLTNFFEPEEIDYELGKLINLD